MTFAERLKGYRKQAGLSQEQMAEKIGVSRQAVTKWETGNGTPDIENIMALAELFQVSLDELLAGEKAEKKQTDYLYESITEYDIDEVKNYDIKFGGANKVTISSYEGEKIRVRLLSNTIKDLQKDIKIKIDDIKNRIDVQLFRLNSMTEALAKEGLIISVLLPKDYISKIEIAVNAKSLELVNIDCENVELDGKVSEVLIDGVGSVVELNSNVDMKINCKSITGAVEINQLSSTSKITVPAGFNFRTVKKGIANRISYEKDGKVVDDFSNEEAENYIELNGIKSELVIYEE